MANLDQLIEQMRNNGLNICSVLLNWINSYMSIYSRFVSNILVNQDKQIVVTRYLKHRGKGDPRINLQDDSGKAKS